MKDATSTSFGLLIAFLLPGLAAFYAVTFWSPGARVLLDTFLKVNSDVGLFLFVLLIALIAGLYVTLLRSLVFESWLCKKQLKDADYAKLATETKLSAFRAAVDETYRYHQFWGGMCIVIPVLFVGWLRSSWSCLTVARIALSLMLFTIVEFVTGYFAYLTCAIFAIRTKRILNS